jgi:hypothetical protein
MAFEQLQRYSGVFSSPYRDKDFGTGTVVLFSFRNIVTALPARDIHEIVIDFDPVSIEKLAETFFI